MSNDNEFEEVKAEIVSGYDGGDKAKPIWLVNIHFSDGSQSIVDEKPSYAEALASAAADGLPVEDNTSFK